MRSKFLLKKLTTILMVSGKKKFIFKKVIHSFENLNFSNNQKAIKNICLLTTIFHRLKPILETRKIRKASKYYEVPFFLKDSRGFSILLRWLVKSIRKQKSLQALTKEFRNILVETGPTFKEVKTLRTKIANNIMYSHYRWK